MAALRKKMTIREEIDLSENDEDSQDEYIRKVKKELDKNKDVDDKLAKQKLKEMRLKLKNKMKRNQDSDDDVGVQLGSAAKSGEESAQYT